METGKEPTIHQTASRIGIGTVCQPYNIRHYLITEHSNASFKLTGSSSTWRVTHVTIYINLFIVELKAPLLHLGLTDHRQNLFSGSQSTDSTVLGIL